MSLFAALGQGDIWALSGISFASPINDLLDKGEFTLENLLEEDELIQEVKSKNERLIEFLSLETTIDHLLYFIITPASDSDNDMRKFKYPYMSCEVICCEVPEILKSLVEHPDQRFLNLLFEFLSHPSKLNFYLAGYFEKILEMLFRRMTIPVMKYFNDSGTTLLVKFLNHVDNYSIMQIVQRLMLPHIPFNNINELEIELSEEERLLYQCNWSFSLEVCQLLFDKMIESEDADIPLHISDLLITVLQLSPPETLVIKFLCEPICIERLLETVVIAEDADVNDVGDDYSTKASASLAAIFVLESLNSRLFESSLPFDQSVASNDSLEMESIRIVKEQIETVCEQINLYIPKLNMVLKQYLTLNPCQPLIHQSKLSLTRLGQRGLQIVKLIESIVRLGNQEIDVSLCSSGTLKTCIDLYFEFVNNSVLHLSIQRIISTILESDFKTRSLTQSYLFEECDLLNVVMDKLSDYSTDAANHTNTTQILPRHSSSIGNLVLIAQALSIALDNNPKSENSGDSSSTIIRTEGITDSIENDEKRLDDEIVTEIILENNTRIIVRDSNKLAQWDSFVQGTLHMILDHQLVGSYDASINLSISQDDHLKIGADLESFNTNTSNKQEFDEDDDDDFMFTGPIRSHYDEADEHAFSANFEFMQTQSFTTDGFETGISSFADFATFDTNVSNSSSNNSEIEPNPFDSEFANFDSIDFDTSSTSVDKI